MFNIIATLAVLAIVALAARYVYKAKKKGQRCIGCPAEHCSRHAGDIGCSGCCHKK